MRSHSITVSCLPPGYLGLAHEPAAIGSSQRVKSAEWMRTREIAPRGVPGPDTEASLEMLRLRFPHW